MHVMPTSILYNMTMRYTGLSYTQRLMLGVVQTLQVASMARAQFAWKAISLGEPQGVSMCPLLQWSLAERVSAEGEFH